MDNAKENRINLEKSVKEMSENPGVYIMRNLTGEIIYIGKAKNLRTRVKSYFSKSAEKEVKTSHLVKKINSIEVITTMNEYEALILENNLIKKWKPKYNISLKDNKTFPVIRITNEDFPRIFRTRRIIDDGSVYFGPYPDVKSIDIYLDIVKKQFKLRKCKEIPLKQKKSPCLYYHIGQCSSPCTGKADKASYNDEIKTISSILAGSIEQIEAELTKKMDAAAKVFDYENAAKYRDVISSIKTLQAEQKVQDFSSEKKDFVSLLSTGINSVAVILQMYEGKISGKSVFKFTSYSNDEENMTRFLMQYYSGFSAASDDKKTALAEPAAKMESSVNNSRNSVLTADNVNISSETAGNAGGVFGNSENLLLFPNKIVVNILPETELLKQFFYEKFKIPFAPVLPEDEKESSIMKMSEENCRLELLTMEKEHTISNALKELQNLLNLTKIPLRIEGFDIAHTAGKNTVSSMVSFYNGKPDKSAYRIFRMKSLPDMAIDDYASIREAVARRYTRILNENLEMPDLILIDGGKGQLNAAAEILKSLEIKEFNIASIAKQEELIFILQQSEPVRLEEGTLPLRIIQHVRDEAHRFATTFNRNMRKKEIAFSLLEDVPGIGVERSKKLITEFGSVENIKNSGSYEISERGKLPLAVAEAVIDYLKENG